MTDDAVPVSGKLVKTGTAFFFFDPAMSAACRCRRVYFCKIGVSFDR